MEYLIWRAQMYETSGQRLKACVDYETAAKSGNSEAQVKAKITVASPPYPIIRKQQPLIIRIPPTKVVIRQLRTIRLYKMTQIVLLIRKILK